MELLLKRSENIFIEKIGEEKARAFFEKTREALNAIPSEFSRDIGSEIPKLMFKLSQDSNEISADKVEGILNHVLYFTNALVDLKFKNRTQVHQMIINKSNHSMRSLLDLLLNFVEKAKNGEIMGTQGNFEDILNFNVAKEGKTTQFKDLELFIKRAQNSFGARIGNELAQNYFEKISKALNQIKNEDQSYVRSEIAKYLFKFSEDLGTLMPEQLEHFLQYTLCFTQSLSELGGKNEEQIRQEIIKRSKNKMRNLFDLFLGFTKKALNNEALYSITNLESIMNHTLKGEEEYFQFSDVGGFVKRVESKYAERIGQEKAKILLNEILYANENIPKEHQTYLGSDIAKFLLKFSETIDRLNPEHIEQILVNTILFMRSLVEISDMTMEQANQFVINRSNHKLRNLFELYKEFLQKIKDKPIKTKEPNFDDILVHALGTYIGPKMIEQAVKIHEIMDKYFYDFPIAKEHARWAIPIYNIIPKFLEILHNDKGDQIIDLLWENKFSDLQIITGFREKLIKLPRDDDRTFMRDLLKLLQWQVLTDEDLDRALTGSVAFVILAQIFIDTFTGRNATIRAIKLRDLLKERDRAGFGTKDIDYRIEKIVEEDFKAIQRRLVLMKEIISVAYTKRYFIKIDDIIEEYYPKQIIKMFSAKTTLKYIGKKYLDSFIYGEMISILKVFLDKLDPVKDFYDKFIEESINVPSDAIEKVELVKKYLESLLELRENMSPNKFFTYNMTLAENALYLFIIKYLLEPIKNTFEIISPVIIPEDEGGMKIISPMRYLSRSNLEENNIQIINVEKEIEGMNLEGFLENSEKLSWLKSSLEQRKNDIKKFELMQKLLNEANDFMSVLKLILVFANKLFSFSRMLKSVHQNLPAALPLYLENIVSFEKEIDYFMGEIENALNYGIIKIDDVNDRSEASVLSKKYLSELSSDESFINQTKILVEVSKKK